MSCNGQSENAFLVTPYWDECDGEENACCCCGRMIDRNNYRETGFVLAHGSKASVYHSGEGVWVAPGRSLLAGASRSSVFT